MSNGLPHKIELEIKEDARLPEVMPFRMSKEHKRKYTEMAEAKVKLAKPCRDALEPVIDALYEEFKRNG